MQATRHPSPRGRTLLRAGARGLLLLLLFAFVQPAFAGEIGSRRCDTRLEPRAIYGRNYVLDRVRICGRVDAPAVVVPVRRDRPAPPSAFGEPLESARQRASWDESRTTLRNAQYDRSVRAGRRAFSRRAR